MRPSPPEIMVECRDGQPRLVNWSGRTFYVRRVLDDWTTETRTGWMSRRTQCFRVETNEGVLELCRRGASWYLSAVTTPADEEAFGDLLVAPLAAS
jgi:hypothetical protein